MQLKPNSFSRVAMKKRASWCLPPNLFEEPYGEWIPIGFPVACLYGCHDHQDEHDDDQNAKQDEANEDEAEEPCNDGVNGLGNLKIQRLLTLLIHKRVIVLLEEPDNERTNDVSKRHTNKCSQRGQMA